MMHLRWGIRSRVVLKGPSRMEQGDKGQLRRLVVSLLRPSHLLGWSPCETHFSIRSVK